VTAQNKVDMRVPGDDQGGTGDLFAWLLDTSNPSARYLTLRDLFEDGEADPAAAQAQARIAQWGPVREILAAMHPEEFWGRFQRPFYGGALSTQATLNLLAELGVPTSPLLEAACEHLLQYGQHPNGGFAPDLSSEEASLCYTGIAIRTLLHFGFAGDPRLERAFDYLVERANRPLGLRCTCWEAEMCGWGVTKALSAFAALPPATATPERMRAAHTMADTILDSLSDLGGRDARWLELGFPLDYQSDLAELCDALAGLSGIDPLGDARFSRLLDALLEIRSPEGWWVKSFGTRALQVERLGSPSKWITIRALRALCRSGRRAAATLRTLLRDERSDT